MNILYTAQATATGGRDGHGKSSDGKLDIQLGMPKELGGTNAGANPEQLFAVGYAACFIGAIKHVAASEKINLPNDLSIASEVSLGVNEDQTFGIAVVLNVSLPGMDSAAAKDLIEKADKVCPYSNAVRGNVNVQLNVNV